MYVYSFLIPTLKPIFIRHIIHYHLFFYALILFSNTIYFSFSLSSPLPLFAFRSHIFFVNILFSFSFKFLYK
ncbi:hypothetical protein BDA99DRAFT_8625 [Phascolomyces articulosus]|uniref:Uncharacterized protein n=1 Tax=Phascolomyces articulosus TaxID=60185 RepID=A0AAD5PJ97_9FUNG|nr:hypothetical protein BDA99DRAFT_8625 [Phascolomyces articulosus]